MSWNQVIYIGRLCTWCAGIVRGCGRQKIGAFINLSAFYIVGIPAASIFAFVCHLRGMVLFLTISSISFWNKLISIYFSVSQWKHILKRNGLKWAGTLAWYLVWSSSADALASLHHLVHQLEQRSKIIKSDLECILIQTLCFILFSMLLVGFLGTEGQW